MILLSNWDDLSYVGIEELVKKSLNCTCICSFRLKYQIPYIRLYEDFAMK
ncbi:MAG: hypothetical protein ACMUEL_04605 [Flavobacteriales bacterium Tduv]